MIFDLRPGMIAFERGLPVSAELAVLKVIVAPDSQRAGQLVARLIARQVAQVPFLDVATLCPMLLADGGDVGGVDADTRVLRGVGRL